MALSVSIHIHFPPTWLFHRISIKLGAHRPHMWGSSKHTSTFSHLSSGMCGSPSDCCGHVCVQARHREVGYIACLLVTYGTGVWVGGACNIHDPWSFVDVFPHFEKYTGVKSGLCANYLMAASELQFCGSLFVFAPSASLNAKKNENIKKANQWGGQGSSLRSVSKWSKELLTSRDLSSISRCSVRLFSYLPAPLKSPPK